MDKKQIKQFLSDDDVHQTTFDVINEDDMPTVGDENGYSTLTHIEEVKPYYNKDEGWSDDELNFYLFRYFKLTYRINENQFTDEEKAKMKNEDYFYSEYKAYEKAYIKSTFKFNNVEEVKEFYPPDHNTIYIDEGGIGFTGEELHESMRHLDYEEFIGEWTEIYFYEPINS